MTYGHEYLKCTGSNGTLNAVYPITAATFESEKSKILQTYLSGLKRPIFIGVDELNAPTTVYHVSSRKQIDFINRMAQKGCVNPLLTLKIVNESLQGTIDSLMISHTAAYIAVNRDGSKTCLVLGE